MTTWTQRAKTHFSQTGANGTAETAERGIDFLQTGISGTAETVKRGVSAVLAVPIGAIREKRDFSKSAEPSTMDDDLQRREGMARAATAEVLAALTRTSLQPSKPSNLFHIDAPWRPLAKAYYAHHVACKACIGAGQGRGQQCDTGAALWTAYQVQINE